ncbi:hypothetical protein ES703_89621 [subsurface metagenome]
MSRPLRNLHPRYLAVHPQVKEMDPVPAVVLLHDGRPAAKERRPFAFVQSTGEKLPVLDAGHRLAFPRSAFLAIFVGIDSLAGTERHPQGVDHVGGAGEADIAGQGEPPFGIEPSYLLKVAEKALGQKRLGDEIGVGLPRQPPENERTVDQRQRRAIFGQLFGQLRQTVALVNGALYAQQDAFYRLPTPPAVWGDDQLLVPEIERGGAV